MQQDDINHCFMVLQVIICVPESETGSHQSPAAEHVTRPHGLDSVGKQLIHNKLCITSYFMKA